MSYQKLVRDKIPEIIKRNDNVEPITRIPRQFRKSKVEKRGAFKDRIYLEGVKENNL